MKRVPEPDLMIDTEQAAAYARADFSQPHDFFVSLCIEKFGVFGLGENVIDLGCGSCDVTLRLAKAYVNSKFVAIDGSQEMLKHGKRAISGSGKSSQIKVQHLYLPTRQLGNKAYDAVVSNSLLHHLKDPQDLWGSVKWTAKPGAAIFVMDLMRPKSVKIAEQLVAENAGDEPEILRRDFYHSLCAAYCPEEIKDQLIRAELSSLSVEVVSDRHLIIFGQV